jgi:adenylate cyclase
MGFRHLGGVPEIVERAHRQVGARLVLANIVGAVAVFTYLQLTDIGPSADDYPIGAQALLLAAQLLVLVPVGMWWGHSRFVRALDWLRAGRSITDDERQRILREPWKQAMRPLLVWVIAAVSWAGLAATQGATAQEIVRIGDGIALGGVTTCTLAYLMIESAFRPLFALALEGAPPRRPSTLGLRPRLLLAWGAGSGVPLLGLALGAADGADMPEAATTVLAVLGLVAGLLAVVAVAHTVAAPLDEVRDALARVREGDLTTTLTVDDGGEIGEVQAGFNRMVHGMRDRERLQDLFGRHVGEEVARHALAERTGLGGEQRDASVVFVDLIGSTAMAEVLPADEVVATLNDFFSAVVGAVGAEGGWVNKFEGDGALCVFGVPGVQPDHAARALRAARRIRAELDRLARDHPGLDAGTGVSSGTVVAGNVGTEQRYEYTVIGPAVNVAARLTDIAKGRSVKVVASGESIDRAGSEGAAWRSVGSVGVRGRAQPTAIFEPRSPLRAEGAVHGLGRDHGVR